MDEVQERLIALADLAREEAEAIRRQDDHAADEVDKRIEHMLGLKERAMGALREHAREHGC